MQSNSHADPERNHKPVVSFIIVARNAANCLGDLLTGYLEQDHSSDQRELIVVVDGASEDETVTIAERSRANHPGLSVRILDNAKKILSSGWNLALAIDREDIILRHEANCGRLNLCRIKRVSQGYLMRLFMHPHILQAIPHTCRRK